LEGDLGDGRRERRDGVGGDALLLQALVPPDQVLQGEDGDGRSHRGGLRGRKYFRWLGKVGPRRSCQDLSSSRPQGLGEDGGGPRQLVEQVLGKVVEAGLAKPVSGS
jgi:hypothetical protein